MPETDILVQPYLRLFGEIFQSHDKENARRFHYSSWREYYQPEIASQVATLAEDSQKTRLLINRLNIGMETLNQRKKDILILHFGLNGHELLTLTDIGKGWGVSREHIRRVENITLQQLRHQLTEDGFTEFLIQELEWDPKLVEKLFSIPTGVYDRLLARATHNLG